MFKWVTEGSKPKGSERELTPDQAKRVWDTLVYLKLKCPMVDLRNTLASCEKWMPAPEQQQISI